MAKKQKKNKKNKQKNRQQHLSSLQQQTSATSTSQPVETIKNTVVINPQKKQQVINDEDYSYVGKDLRKVIGFLLLTGVLYGGIYYLINFTDTLSSIPYLS